MYDFGFYHEDCLQGMKQFSDGYFDLAIVDPPYGINCMSFGYTKSGGKQFGHSATKGRDYRKSSDWDIKPGEEYFKELMRVSKKQIIWGGNYFTDILPPTKSFIIWDKRCNDKIRNSFADCEYAWCSEGLGVARVFRFVWNGMMQGDMRHKEERFHPTQKPVALYVWILNNYAKPGDVILDTHVGSGSSLIACHRTQHKYIGFEIDEEYYQKASKRIEQETAQMSIFDFKI